MEEAECQVRIASAVIASDELGESLLAKGRTIYIAVVPVLVGMGKSAAVASVPHCVMSVACKVYRVVGHSVVGLVASGEVGAHFPLGNNRISAKYDDACHRIRTVHQTGWPLDDFRRMHRCRVYLNSVLVAPLLSFLSDAIVYHHHTIVAQSAYDRLRYAAASGYL